MKIRTAQGFMSIRVAGICQHRGQVLLHKAKGDSFWALPGGSVNFQEAAAKALIREMQEELGEAIVLGAFAGTAENFFVHQGVSWHELGLYYHFSFKSPQRYEQAFFQGIEPEKALEFAWTDLAQLGSVDCRPSFLRDLLPETRALPFFISKRDSIASPLIGKMPNAKGPA